MWQAMFTALLVALLLLIAGGAGYLSYRLVREER
jgi:hypothetical protein